MRAINLVPAEARPGRVNGGKSGGGVYALLGVLALMILAASVFALAKRDEARALQDLTAVEQSTQAYTQVATKYSSFEQAASQATERINTVRSLADARFDWAGSMRDLSRLVPVTTRISSLSASVVPDAQAGGGAQSQFRGAIGSPAISMAGCTKSQDSAATLVTQLQAMRRVTNVTLESSKQKLGTGGDGSGSLCTDYEFVIVVFFAAGGARASTQDGPTGSATGGATTVSTESAGTATPASTTPASGN